MLGTRTIAIVIPQMSYGIALSIVVVAVDREDWNVELPVVLAIGGHALPVRIECRVLQILLQPRIRNSVDLVDLVERPAGLVPLGQRRLDARAILELFGHLAA